MKFFFSTPLGLDVGLGVSPKKQSVGAVIGAGISAVGSLLGNQMQNNANSNLNRENQLFQSGMLHEQQNWSEKMWNKENEYNTPLSQRQRLQEAGFNPWISGSGGSMSNVAQTPGSQGSTPAPQSMPMRYDNPFQNLGNTINDMVRTKAESANQLSQAAQNCVNTAVALYEKTGDWDAANHYLAVGLKGIGGAHFSEDSMYFQQLNLIIRGRELQNASQKLQNDFDVLRNQIQSKTGEAIADATLFKIQQEGKVLGEQINNLVKDTLKKGQEIENLKESKRLITQEIKTSVAQMVSYYAEAYKLRKEGDKFVADTETINQIRQHVVADAKNQANISYNQSWLNYYNAVEGKAKFDQRTESRNWLTSPEGKQNALGMTKLDNDKYFHAVDKSVEVIDGIMPSFFVTNK